MRTLRTALAATCALFWAQPGWSQITVVPDTSRVIHVTGRATIATPPDIATVSVGVVALDGSPKRAKASVDETIGRIVSVAEGLKRPETGIRTTAINVEPRYSDERETKLLGFEVTRSVTIELRDLTALDALLDGAVAAGANNDFSVQLTSSKQESLRRQALEAAVDAAKAQAQAIVARLGARLGPIRTINLDKAPTNVAYSMSVTSSTHSARFQPGEIKVDAEVSLTFSLLEEGGSGK